jgi:hypothetical protein
MGNGKYENERLFFPEGPCRGVPLEEEMTILSSERTFFFPTLKEDTQSFPPEVTFLYLNPQRIKAVFFVPFTTCSGPERAILSQFCSPPVMNVKAL